MIKSKKGIESFPFFLFLTILIAVFVLTISFQQIGVLTGFSDDKTMTDSYKSMTGAMETLRASSDFGSFTRIKLEIPKGYNLTFSADNNTITIAGKKNLVNQVDFELLNFTDKYGEVVDSDLTLKPGTYELVIYYGETTSTFEPYEIFFR